MIIAGILFLLFLVNAVLSLAAIGAAAYVAAGGAAVVVVPP